MENWKNYTNLNFGIPQYAVMETLRAMRDKAEPDPDRGFEFYVKCKDPFGVGKDGRLELYLLANARCVGMQVSCIEIVQTDPGEFYVFFDLYNGGVE